MPKNSSKNQASTQNIDSVDFRKLSHQILQLGQLEESRVDFLSRLVKSIKDFTECQYVELRVFEAERCHWYRINLLHENELQLGTIECTKNDFGDYIPDRHQTSDFDTLFFAVQNGIFPKYIPFVLCCGVLWINDSIQPMTIPANQVKHVIEKTIRLSDKMKSLLMMPLLFGDQKIGLLILKNEQTGYFTNSQMKFYEAVAEMLGVTLAYQNVQAALRERVKELTCLYGISQVARWSGLTVEGILRKIVHLLPPGWQYPEITQGQIVLDEVTYQTNGFIETPWIQTADIVVNDTSRGHVHVVYTEKKPVLDEGPFLNEERKLITAIARQVAIIIEHYEGLEEKIRLQEQLRHSDRLATIGQLAAGVAHEMNEPLANILGFAQLALKDNGLPKQAESDLQKIVESSLYGKDVIQKLLIFARQTPPSKTIININETISSALSFFKKRFTEKGITLHPNLNPDIPEIVVDKAQITQVIINLCVNAIHAMSYGDDLKISTSLNKDNVQIVVEDNGVGMSEDVRKRIFLPFFTTKDVDQGTGLGLAVVHGIITSHKGTIEVESKVDEGTRFTIKLPVDSATSVKDKQNGQ